MSNSSWRLAGSLLLLALVASSRSGLAGDGCCCLCGAPDSQQVCRLVCEDKKVTVTCWGYKEEDFCVGGCSEMVCQHCETVCDDCDNPKAPAHSPKRFLWTEWIPKGSPRIYTRQKLMKKTITKKVPTYKWVVEDLCAHCEAAQPKVTPEPGAKIPPVPAADKPGKADKPAPADKPGK